MEFLLPTNNEEIVINLDGEHVQPGLGVFHCSADELFRLYHHDNHDDGENDNDDNQW